jgi:hypothetical protein
MVLEKAREAPVGGGEVAWDTEEDADDRRDRPHFGYRSIQRTERTLNSHFVSGYKQSRHSGLQ